MRKEARIKGDEKNKICSKTILCEYGLKCKLKHTE